MTDLRKALAAACIFLSFGTGCGDPAVGSVPSDREEKSLSFEYFAEATSAQQEFYRKWEALADDPVPEAEIFSQPGAYSSETVDDAMNAQLMLMLDKPEYSQILLYYTVYPKEEDDCFTITALYDSSECDLAENIRRRNEAMSRIREKAREFEELPTSLEKYRAAYDWLAHTAYDSSEEPPVSVHTIYGSAIEELSRCDGLAYTYTLLCREMGLPCCTAAGTVEGEPHIWNIVPFENQSRLVDVTSGQDEVTNGELQYLRFLVSDISADGRKPLEEIPSITNH